MLAEEFERALPHWWFPARRLRTIARAVSPLKAKPRNLGHSIARLLRSRLGGGLANRNRPGPCSGGFKST
jgi:hypothetical protein